MDQQYEVNDGTPQTPPGSSSSYYDETPPPPPPQDTASSDTYPPQKPQSNVASIITAVIAFILLFVIGFWISGVSRQYLGNLFSGKKSTTTTPTPTRMPVGSIEATPIATTGATTNTSASPKTYQVLNGTSRVPFAGISFTLPVGVLSPICDGSACGSQGTYLPGGTRFTIALRGEGQVLPDYRGRIISDLRGVEFPLKEVNMFNRTVTEFSGSFTGTTVGGYVFSQMHGYMIPLSDVLSLEVNHFTPGGITTDFAKDEEVFNQIMKSFVLPSTSEKGGVQTTATTTPVAQATLTPTPTTSTSMKTSADEICTKTNTQSSMSYADAVSIVNKSTCASQGKVLTTRSCNASKGVWWIDIEKSGSTCKNICEVDIAAKTTKFINNCP